MVRLGPLYYSLPVICARRLISYSLILFVPRMLFASSAHYLYLAWLQMVLVTSTQHESSSVRTPSLLWTRCCSRYIEWERATENGKPFPRKILPGGFWNLTNTEHFRPVTCRAELNVGQRPMMGHEIKNKMCWRKTQPQPHRSQPPRGIIHIPRRSPKSFQAILRE